MPRPPKPKRSIHDPDWPFYLPEEWGETGRTLFYRKLQKWLDDVATGRTRWGDDVNRNPKEPTN